MNIKGALLEFRRTVLGQQPESSTNQPCCFDQIPSDSLKEIVSTLDISSIINFSQVSKSLYRLCGKVEILPSMSLDKYKLLCSLLSLDRGFIPAAVNFISRTKFDKKLKDGIASLKDNCFIEVYAKALSKYDSFGFVEQRLPIQVEMNDLTRQPNISQQLLESCQGEAFIDFLALVKSAKSGEIEASQGQTGIMEFCTREFMKRCNVNAYLISKADLLAKIGQLEHNEALQARATVLRLIADRDFQGL